ncbi:MAG: DUF469 family protein [Vicinamibacteria bacterium]|nr:DUF469 family protein [Vicinamibacteria bacterium]
MRKRLRKKREEGEFAGYSFGVSYVLDDVSSQRANEFLDRFVENAIEPNGLECHGARWDREWDFRVARADDSKPSAAQRAAVIEWLKSRKEVSRFNVEELS